MRLRRCERSRLALALLQLLIFISSTALALHTSFGGHNRRGLVPTGQTTELRAAAFDAALLESSGPVLLVVSSPHCGHCVRLKPAWDAACAQLASSGVACARVDASERVLLRRLNVKGLPDIRLVSGTEMRVYSGPRTAPALASWAAGQYRATKPLTGLKSPLSVLGRLYGRMLRLPEHASQLWVDTKAMSGLGNTGMSALCVLGLLLGFGGAIAALDVAIGLLPVGEHQHQG